MYNIELRAEQTGHMTQVLLVSILIKATLTDSDAARPVSPYGLSLGPVHEHE